jgi:hypothetical protein
MMPVHHGSRHSWRHKGRRRPALHQSMALMKDWFQKKNRPIHRRHNLIEFRMQPLLPLPRLPSTLIS